MRLRHVGVERLDVERELPEIGGLDLVDLQLEGDEALRPSVKEDEVGLHMGHYPGCLVAFEMEPGERAWRVLGEWPPKPSRG